MSVLGDATYPFVSLAEIMLTSEESTYLDVPICKKLNSDTNEITSRELDTCDPTVLMFEKTWPVTKLSFFHWVKNSHNPEEQIDSARIKEKEATTSPCSYSLHVQSNNPKVTCGTEAEKAGFLARACALSPNFLEGETRKPSLCKLLLLVSTPEMKGRCTTAQNSVFQN